MTWSVLWFPASLHNTNWSSQHELSRLPQLVILTILNYPRPGPGLFSIPVTNLMDFTEISEWAKTAWEAFATGHSRAELPCLLNRFAVDVMRYFYHSMVSNMRTCPIITFGSRAGERRYDPDSWRWVSYEPTAYYPGSQTNQYGRQELSAIAARAQEVEFDEPESDILKYALYHCQNMPD